MPARGAARCDRGTGHDAAGGTLRAGQSCRGCWRRRAADRHQQSRPAHLPDRPGAHAAAAPRRARRSAPWSARAASAPRATSSGWKRPASTRCSSARRSWPGRTSAPPWTSCWAITGRGKSGIACRGSKSSASRFAGSIPGSNAGFSIAPSWGHLRAPDHVVEFFMSTSKRPCRDRARDPNVFHHPRRSGRSAAQRAGDRRNAISGVYGRGRTGQHGGLRVEDRLVLQLCFRHGDEKFEIYLNAQGKEIAGEPVAGDVPCPLIPIDEPPLPVSPEIERLLAAGARLAEERLPGGARGRAGRGDGRLVPLRRGQAAVYDRRRPRSTCRFPAGRGC